LNRALRSSLCLGLILGQGVAACDPNVVIGARFRGAGGGSPPVSMAGTEPVTTTGGSGDGGTGGLPAAAGTGAVGGGGSGGASGGEPAGGAGGDGGEAGEPGSVFFTADHEDGSNTLEQWNEGPDDDAGGYYGDVDSGSPTLSTEQYHSGKASAKATIDTRGGTDQISRLYRRVSADEAYYSAWFFLGEDHTPTRWWSFFLFRAVQDRAKSIDLWSVDLIREGTDELTLTLFRHATNSNVDIPAKPIVPVGKWFQLEAYLRAKPGEPCRLTLWLDGQEILALDDEAAPPANQPLYWVIGNGAAPFTPAISNIYIDDAVISSTRTGP
jgi:hypothetical protein